MEDPQVTMGFNTKSWMIWGFDFRKPPYSISRFVHRFCSQVWEYKDQGGTFGGTNRPYAGAWGEDKPLEKGEHKIQLYSMGTPPLGINSGVYAGRKLRKVGWEKKTWSCFYFLRCWLFYFHFIKQ